MEVVCSVLKSDPPLEDKISVRLTFTLSYVPGTVLSAVQVLYHLIVMTTLCIVGVIQSYFIVVETEAQSLSLLLKVIRIESD